MPKDEDRSLLIWISPGFDLARLAWMIYFVKLFPRRAPHEPVMCSCSIRFARNANGACYDNGIIRFAYIVMSKGMDRKKEVKKPKKDKNKK